MDTIAQTGLVPAGDTIDLGDFPATQFVREVTNQIRTKPTAGVPHYFPSSFTPGQIDVVVRYLQELGLIVNAIPATGTRTGYLTVRSTDE